MKHVQRFALPSSAAAEGGATDPPPAEGDAGAPTQRFAEGAAVRVKGDPHMAGQAAGDVTKAMVTDVYAVTFDGADSPYCYYTGDELEPDDEQEETGPKSKPPAARAPLPRAPAAARASAIMMQGLGARVMQKTGAPTPDAAFGAVETWSRSHAALPGALAELTKLRAAADSGKRLAVLERGVVAGVWTPGKAWRDGDKAKGPSAWASAPHKGPKGEQLGQSLEQLEADLAASVPLSFAGPATSPAASGVLSAEELPAAGANGATPEQWTAARASVLSGTLPTRPAKTTTKPRATR